MTGGGPKTTAGKAAASRNAVRHGLTARTRANEILGGERVGQCFPRLRDEWRPATATEEHLVREMARHQAFLERIQKMEDAVLRRGARGALDLGSAGDEGACDEDEWLDVALAGAGTSELVSRITRYRRSHERAFLKSLAVLRDLRAASTTQRTDCAAGTQNTPPANKARFATEEDCQEYLLSRLRDGKVACLKCEARQGNWISSRQVWKCRDCGRQSSARANTVTAGSHLSLLPWFRAIETLLRAPHTSIAELIEVTAVRRTATVRRMARRIREAVASQNASAALAGLDEVFDVIQLRTEN